MPRKMQKELLDADGIPFEDIRQNMKELNAINTWLGGHAITITGLKKIMQQAATPVKVLSICETGCGGGDNLLAIQQWGNRNGMRMRLTGIDIKKDCIEYARENNTNTSFEWIQSDYRLVNFPTEKPDIIFCSLFCHHFSDDELVAMMQWMQQNSRLGFFINDLHRHRAAYYAIKILTQLFSKSYLVKHDAPLSVMRGFKRKEWKSILQRAGITHYDITWKWAFRWLITVYS